MVELDRDVAVRVDRDVERVVELEQAGLFPPPAVAGRSPLGRNQPSRVFRHPRARSAAQTRSDVS
jgi:hypothetical protein